MKNLLNTPVDIYGRRVHNRILFQPMEGCDGTADGAIFIKDGKVIEENTYYRDYLTVTHGQGAEFIKVSPVPCEQKSFEYYLKG